MFVIKRVAYERFRCSIAEKLHETVYIRLLEAYCETPEEGF